MGITILYTCNLHNTVRQLYFRKKKILLSVLVFSLHRFPQRSSNLLLEKHKTGWQCSGSRAGMKSELEIPQCSNIYIFIFFFRTVFPLTQHHSVVPSVTPLGEQVSSFLPECTRAREDNHPAVLTAAETGGVYLLIKSTLLFPAHFYVPRNKFWILGTKSSKLNGTSAEPHCSLRTQLFWEVQS